MLCISCKSDNKGRYITIKDGLWKCPACLAESYREPTNEASGVPLDEIVSNSSEFRIKDYEFFDKDIENVLVCDDTTGQGLSTVELGLADGQEALLLNAVDAEALAKHFGLL